MSKTEEMNHWERLRATLRDEPTDRPPISLWRHWPVTDETPEGLAAAMIAWQKEYRFDFVKFMPTGTYGIEDWGARTIYEPNDHGVRTVTRYGIQDAAEWPTLAQLDVTRDYLGNQVDAVRLAATELAGSVPILQTVFSPLTTARKLAGDRVLADLRCHPGMLEQGLQVIAETTARFALESLRAGAHGIFFATQCATFRLLSESEYRRFGEVYDQIVLDAVQSEAEFVLLHAHGHDLMFDLLVDYEPDALNWHDREAGPSLADAQARFEGVVVGGVNEWETLLEGPPEAIRAEIKDAVAQTGGHRHIVGPGCVLSTDTPREYVRAARDAISQL